MPYAAPISEGLLDPEDRDALGRGHRARAVPPPSHLKDPLEQATVQGGSCTEGACCKKHCTEKRAERVDAGDGCVHGEVERDVGGSIGGHRGQWEHWGAGWGGGYG